jgi:hypothetical protein
LDAAAKNLVSVATARSNEAGNPRAKKDDMTVVIMRVPRSKTAS